MFKLNLTREHASPVYKICRKVIEIEKNTIANYTNNYYDTIHYDFEFFIKH